jgi:hypothetical protein
MKLKEEVEDPKIIQRISAILIPREFTKLDEIINLVFTTAEDVKEEKPSEPESAPIEEQDEEVKTKPVSFNEACIERIEKRLQQPLVKRSRTSYSSADDSVRVTCAVSKLYEKGGQTQYWFAFHPHQKDFLEAAKTGYVAFGCGTEKTLLFIPLVEFLSWLDGMHRTEDANRFYWHINIMKDEENLVLYRRKGTPRINLNLYVLST